MAARMVRYGMTMTITDLDDLLDVLADNAARGTDKNEVLAEIIRLSDPEISNSGLARAFWEKLERENPDFLVQWLRDRGIVVMTDFVRSVRNRDRRGGFNEVQSIMDTLGDPEASRERKESARRRLGDSDLFSRASVAYEQATGARKAIGKLNERDERQIGKYYDGQSKYNRRQAAFHNAVARRLREKRLELGLPDLVIEEAFTVEQYALLEQEMS